jgi:hypothetical protein
VGVQHRNGVALLPVGQQGQLTQRSHTMVKVRVPADKGGCAFAPVLAMPVELDSNQPQCGADADGGVGFSAVCHGPSISNSRVPWSTSRGLAALPRGDQSGARVVDRISNLRGSFDQHAVQIEHDQVKRFLHGQPSV